jgi:hypothetical protein
MRHTAKNSHTACENSVAYSYGENLAWETVFAKKVTQKLPPSSSSSLHSLHTPFRHKPCKLASIRQGFYIILYTFVFELNIKLVMVRAEVCAEHFSAELVMVRASYRSHLRHAHALPAAIVPPSIHCVYAIIFCAGGAARGAHGPHGCARGPLRGRGDARGHVRNSRLGTARRSETA